MRAAIVPGLVLLAACAQQAPAPPTAEWRHDSACLSHNRAALDICHSTQADLLYRRYLAGELSAAEYFDIRQELRTRQTGERNRWIVPNGCVAVNYPPCPEWPAR